VSFVFNPLTQAFLSLRVRETIRRDPIGWGSSCGIKSLCATSEASRSIHSFVPYRFVTPFVSSPQATGLQCSHCLAVLLAYIFAAFLQIVIPVPFREKRIVPQKQFQINSSSYPQEVFNMKKPSRRKRKELFLFIKSTVRVFAPRAGQKPASHIGYMRCRCNMQKMAKSSHSFVIVFAVSPFAYGLRHFHPTGVELPHARKY
jgi:hypothetical protein